MSMITIQLPSAGNTEENPDNRTLELGLGENDTIHLQIGSASGIYVTRSDLHKALTVLDRWNAIPKEG